jgi:hypothetical protein
MYVLISSNHAQEYKTHLADRPIPKNEVRPS